MASGITYAATEPARGGAEAWQVAATSAGPAVSPLGRSNDSKGNGNGNGYGNGNGSGNGNGNGNGNGYGNGNGGQDNGGDRGYRGDHGDDYGDRGDRGYDDDYGWNRIHINERDYPAVPDGCITVVSGLGADSLNVRNDSWRTVEVFNGATCDNGAPLATVGPHSSSNGLFPRQVKGGVQVEDGVVGSFRVVREYYGHHRDYDYDYDGE
ncbi:hypothetical protein ABZ468_22310 [Streptomyces sp. NPDC005708]|uniref:hypothetical protein n=1 Tax=Streptomyces sp. NPDC005708 TaxID=3154564 RepID=UPI0033D0C33B